MLVQSQVIRSVFYGCALAFSITIFLLTPFAHHIEHRFGLGLLFGLRQPVAPPKGALIVAIDRKTISWLRDISNEPHGTSSSLVSCLPDRTISELRRLRGPSSLPRPLYACLLAELKHLGFPIVVFDVLFSVAGIADDDMMLAQAIRSHGATAILIGFEKYMIEEGASDLSVQRVIQPLSLFRESAAAAGFFLVPRSGGPVYGYRRRIPEFQETRSLVEEAIDLHGRLKSYVNSNSHGEKELTYLWFYGVPGSIKTVSIRDILSGKIPEAIRASTSATAVFVGVSDPTMSNYKDSYPSMYRGKTGAEISGVELAATAYLNLLSGHNLHRLPWLREALVCGIYAFVLGFLARAPIGYSLLAIPGFALAYLITAIVTFFHYQLFLPTVTPVFIAAPAAFLIAVMVRSSIAHALIIRLAPAPIARRMLAKSAIHRGEVVSNDATVIFFDLIESTTIGNNMNELDFGNLMNAYHDIVTQEVESHHGYVIAFAGDGVTAVFDSSNAGSNHALLACRSTIATIRKIRNLNLDNENCGVAPLNLRIGLNSGHMATGGIGGQERFNYAVVGDVVNLASRLEKLGKILFPNEKNVILVGSATRQMVKGQSLSLVDCGLHSTPGRQVSENVFRLLVD